MVIPETLAGMSVEEATATLKDLGLAVNPENGSIDSPTIPVNAVAETDPQFGSYVAPGSEIQLLISTGPKLIDLPPFAGMTEDDAKAAIENAPFTLADPIIRQFDGTVIPGTVIDALATDGSSLTGVAQYGERQEITLVVSAGPLPDIAGQSTDEAKATLEGVGLQLGAIKEDEYSDTIPQGAAIRAQATDGTSAVRVGDTVDVITSRGVEQVTIPDVVGQTWAEAKPQLEAAGFELNYNGVADLLPATFIVSQLTPEGATDAPKGSVVKINFSS